MCRHCSGRTHTLLRAGTSKRRNRWMKWMNCALLCLSFRCGTGMNSRSKASSRYKSNSGNNGWKYVEAHRARWPVKVINKLLSLDTNNFYDICENQYGTYVVQAALKFWALAKAPPPRGGWQGVPCASAWHASDDAVGGNSPDSHVKACYSLGAPSGAERADQLAAVRRGGRRGCAHSRLRTGRVRFLESPCCGHSCSRARRAGLADDIVGASLRVRRGEDERGGG